VSGGWSLIHEVLTELIAATRGDVSEPLMDLAGRAESAELGDMSAFSEFLSDSVPAAIERFDTAAEGALYAAAEFAAALADAVESSHQAYEDADRRSAEELVRLTEELR